MSVLEGYYRVGVGIPAIKVADVTYNTNEILKIVDEGKKAKVGLLIFPELALTGATCGDLFWQEALYCGLEHSLDRLLEGTKNSEITLIVGAPMRKDGACYNGAYVIQSGEILAFVADADSSQNYFSVVQNESLCMIGKHTFSVVSCLDKSLRINDTLTAQVVFGDGEKTDCQPNNKTSLLLHMDADKCLVGSKERRLKWAKAISEKQGMAYIYANASSLESTTDYVFDGLGFVIEKGECLLQTNGFAMDSQLYIEDIEIGALQRQRQVHRGHDLSQFSFIDLKVQSFVSWEDSKRIIPQNPFLPENTEKRESVLQEALEIQTMGLVKRMLHIQSNHIVIGISGGLDSTLALIVSVLAKKRLEETGTNITIHSITMPGYGTSNKTYSNAHKLMDLLGVAKKEISIKESCDLHLKEIGHGGSAIHDVTFENAQARERTQILMDYANMVGGLVVGTGDFTELALGFATYNGDHMSNYGVNGNIPKTVVRELVRYSAKLFGAEAGEVLNAIADTPISPELIPPNEQGEITQKTEEVVGPYELNDFFMYYILKDGLAPTTIIKMAEKAFLGLYDRNSIVMQLSQFYRGFFANQFKRSCLPDGPQVFDISLSPRGGWAMPTDSVASVWLESIGKSM